MELKRKKLAAAQRQRILTQGASSSSGGLAASASSSSTRPAIAAANPRRVPSISAPRRNPYLPRRAPTVPQPSTQQTPSVPQRASFKPKRAPFVPSQRTPSALPRTSNSFASQYAPPRIPPAPHPPSTSSVTPVCKFFLQGKCLRGVHCHFSHQKPTLCKICQKPLPQDKAQRDQHSERCVESKLVSLEKRASLTLKCCICEKVVVQTDQEKKFGILTNCKHVFCYSCIRDYKPSNQGASKSASGQKVCPVCKKPTELILSLDRMVLNEDRKAKFVTIYKNRLRQIPCRRFNFGKGQCPWGGSCLYSHRTSPNGAEPDQNGAMDSSTNSKIPDELCFKWGRGDARRLKKRQLAKERVDRETRAKRPKTSSSSSNMPIEILSDDEEEELADWGDDTRDGMPCFHSFWC